MTTKKRTTTTFAPRVNTWHGLQHNKNLPRLQYQGDAMNRFSR